MTRMNRRSFVGGLAATGIGIGFRNAANLLTFANAFGLNPAVPKPVVSVVRIKNDDVDYAVSEAIDLLGGMRELTEGKERIMLKPNLVSPEPRDVTKPGVIRALAKLMIQAKKDVLIGEGSAAAEPNLRPGIFGGVCRTAA